ncbi:diguanylate cyclase [Janthinobacterium sp. UMAB-56]|uniref:diguanylate cyclase n=1 Tax=Janthinobacterium sp. UMAB-56 TaxID=1365361 RepID=UPI001C5763E3|nr:diguanylate cyclase [Janthinobacterium sp. UMAB-56]
MNSLAEEQSRILIIDDSVTSIRLLSAILKDLGRIWFATSGEAGIALAREHQPQVILLDVEMPLMSGYEVCKLLKENSDTRDASIIFITARSSMESEIQALEAGAVDFITKPLNQPVVRARVCTQLNVQRQAQALIRLANRDGLTGLFNRRYFNEMIALEFSRHQRQGHFLGLALIDIDHFKAFNDGYGHLNGDTCLSMVAQTIALETKRPGEIVARYGGEEFVAILPHTTLEDASKYGAWLCEKVDDLKIPHQFSSCASVVTISVGVAALVPSENSTIRDLINAADQALYRAKAAGRNRVVASDSA